jgi:hypothetical protein
MGLADELSLPIMMLMFLNIMCFSSYHGSSLRAIITNRDVCVIVSVLHDDHKDYVPALLAWLQHGSRIGADKHPNNP